MGKFHKLNRLALRALLPGESITEHGITAERLSDSDLRYAINIMVDRQRIHRVIGRESEGVTREQAERAIESLRTKAREGRLYLPSRRKTFPTFSELGEEYLKRIEADPHGHGRNLARKQRHMRELLAPYFRRTRPDKMSDLAVAGYARWRREAGVATATINRELSTLNHFLARAVEWKWIKDKPRISKGKESRKQIVTLSAADQQKLIRAAIGDQDPYTWLFAAIALGTGMRHGEIVRIRWDEIDFAHRRIHIPQAKAGQREQPITAALAETLKKERDQRPDQMGWLFPTKRKDAKRPHRQTMAEQFRRAVERAKLDPAKVTPHVLRHTAITALVKAGVDLPTIQRISGHKTLAMVLRYTHLTDDHVDQAVAKLDTGFSHAIAPELHTATETAERGAV